MMKVGKHTLDNGGGTFDRAGEPMQFDSGYAVGLVEGTARKCNTGGLDRSVAEWLIERNFDRVRHNWPDAAYIGTWVDDKGDVHIDPIDTRLHLFDALQLARKNKQVAIYDFANNEEIML